MPPQPAPKEFIDTLGTFEGGTNSYLPPLLLPKNQLAVSLNTTVRGDYVTQRSILRKRYLDPVSQGILNLAISQGVFQEAIYYKPDGGSEGIATIIGGQLITIVPDPDVNTAKATTINSWYAAAWVSGHAYSAGNTASRIISGVSRDFLAINAVTSTVPPENDQVNWQALNQSTGQNWMWQSEQFLIWNDGASNPIFYNTDTFQAVRSLFGTPTNQTTSVTNPFTMLAPGTTGGTTVVVTSNANMSVGDNLYFLNFGNAVVLTKNVDGVTITVNNINVRTGSQIKATAAVSWTEAGNNPATGGAQLPPGRMGTYGMGRNWFSGPDGNNFYASDVVGGASGTAALDYRDAPLNITENTFLAGGGSFRVPGANNIVNITAMKFVANLDTSLGQGPLQVFTLTQAFSCQTPVDRLTWQDVTNPILTESIKGFGATGQDSTINVNSDLLFRSLVGFSSQILARRDFDTWGNVPISTEVSVITDADNQTLLNWGSAILFDNRVLWTAKPQTTTQGVIHKAIIPLNLDPVSSLRGKQPSVYDSLQWTGLNVFKLVTGSFANNERAFALCWDNINNNVDLYEILKDSDTSQNGDTTGIGDIVRIVWAFNTASLFRESSRTFKRLVDGEIFIDELVGEVDFQSYFKPDQYPCFQPWQAWTECQTQPRNGVVPGFRPRMGMGSPRKVQCDPTTNRSLDLGYTFDVRFVITGKCRFLGGRFKAVEQPEPEFAQPNCTSEAQLTAMLAITGTTPVPPAPVPPQPGNIMAIVDDSGNILVDSSGNYVHS